MDSCWTGNGMQVLFQPTQKRLWTSSDNKKTGVSTQWPHWRRWRTHYFLKNLKILRSAWCWGCKTLRGEDLLPFQLNLRLNQNMSTAMCGNLEDWQNQLAQQHQGTYIKGSMRSKWNSGEQRTTNCRRVIEKPISHIKILLNCHQRIRVYPIGIHRHDFYFLSSSKFPQAILISQ